MLRVLVMNAKGGCGKTTIATNLASYCAGLGAGVTLLDYDPQGSSSRWLRNRPDSKPPIHGIAAYQEPAPGTTRSWQMRIPSGTEFVITDTPAGTGGFDLAERISECDCILIPVLPSSIDIHSTADFIRDLLLKGKARAQGKPLAIIANRARIRTRAQAQLERFLNSLDIPVIGHVRDTQFYVSATQQGLGVHELPPRESRQDRGSWEDIMIWLEQLRDAHQATRPPSPSRTWASAAASRRHPD